MSEKVYEKYLSVEQLQNMKASTLRKLKGKEESSVAAFIVFVAVSFMEIIAVVAALLWMNKFTLFLSIIGALFVILCGCILRSIFKDYKESIKVAKKESTE